MTRRWDFVSGNRAAFGVQRICRVLQVSRSGCCQWLAGTTARAGRQVADGALVAEIREIHAEHKGTYGVRRVHAELRGFGHTVNRKRGERLMRINGIEGRHLRRRKRTTVPDRLAPPAPDLVQRKFCAGQLDEKWCGDITYVQAGGAWLYLACVIDICSRRVLGYSMAPHMRAELVIDALKMAVATRGGSVNGVIFHADRGAVPKFRRVRPPMRAGPVKRRSGPGPRLFSSSKAFSSVGLPRACPAGLCRAGPCIGSEEASNVQGFGCWRPRCADGLAEWAHIHPFGVWPGGPAP
ncbi:IS3 family transposase [Streptomyces spiralis]|uniref:IS3 family transposase n=1 Tax=Streptomyces spiralis TaxID=66376 RepID=UPI0036CEFC67